MCETGIASCHIQKLTHRIPEIRVRALFSILSKLENGFTFDNHLARTRELLSNLFNWFLFEPCCHEQEVLCLIERLLQSPSGSVLISHCGKAALQQEIEKIKSYLEPKFHSKLNDILNVLSSKSSVNVEIPPLGDDVPLSYRSNGLEDWIRTEASPMVGATATTIHGVIQKESSLGQEIGAPQSSIDGSIYSDKPTYRIASNKHTPSKSTVLYGLKWQPLIETDQNVLQSVQESLKNPQDSSVLFHSCEFFIQVLLQDFPAEVFIQRPGIIKIFYEIISTCRSTKLTNIILQCLYDLTKALHIRINHSQDPCIKNLKTEMLPNLVSFCEPPYSNRNSDEPSSSDHFELSEESNILKNNQFTLPDFCFKTMNIVLKCMTFKEEGLREHKPRLNQVGVNMCLVLLDELVNLLYRAVGDDLWDENQSADIMVVLKDINNTLSLFGDTLEYFRLESLSLETNLKCRAIYIFLLCICTKWLKHIIPLSKTRLILPKNFKLSLTNSLLDITLGRLYPKVHRCLLQFVESFSSTTDLNCLKKYEDVMKVCDGLTASVNFLKDRGSSSTIDKFKLAHTALPSIDFHRNLEFLSTYIGMCSDKLYNFRDNHEIMRLAKGEYSGEATPPKQRKLEQIITSTDTCVSSCMSEVQNQAFVKERYGPFFDSNQIQRSVNLMTCPISSPSHIPNLVNSNVIDMVYMDHTPKIISAYTVLRLLAHRLPEIQQEMYILCHKKVIENIGTQISWSDGNSIGSGIYFLLNADVLTQITMFGLKNEAVKQYAEEILLYILKSKVIVADDIWHKCVEALIPSLPIIICYADNSTALGRTIINCVDPDSAKDLGLPDIVMLKGNVELLFSSDSIIRDEAFSRLCWLLAKQENSREILPKFNTIYDRALSNACNVRNILDLNKIRKTDHFYQPSSFHQVFELLKSDKVEPVIRRSALNQVSVMMDDPLLHDLFLDAAGIDLMVCLMKKALQENDFSEYPDSIIPIVSILKNLALYHSSVREDLALNPDVFFYTLRGLFLFFTDDRMRQDASILLFLLIFKDTLRGSPGRADFSLLALANEKLLVPFTANTHTNLSSHTSEDLFSAIAQDRWSLTSLQVQWNADLRGGFNNLIRLDEVDYANNSEIETNEILALKNSDLKQIKVSSLHYCIDAYLMRIQSATSHCVVEDCITKLILYVHLYNLSTQLSDSENNQFLSHPWERTFVRYLEILPSSDEDIYLLMNVIRFLNVLVPFYKESDICWISSFLKNRSNSLLDVLAAGNILEEDTKILNQELLKLITHCVVREHNYLDFYSTDDQSSCSDWDHIITIISDNLKFSETQHFYNLAYLDALLSCLVNLTARLGWSRSKPSSSAKKPIPQLISSLCELLTAFHCGKGASATVSVMGLSISRNVMLILNHLLAELHHFKLKKWEEYFFDNDDTRTIRSFLAMWGSRDVILRAAALQLFHSLTISPKATEEIISDLNQDNGNIWELALTVVTDHTEAGVVRENAALLLANLSSHMLSTPCTSPSVLLSVSSCNMKKDSRNDVLALLEEYDFYNHLEIVLTSLFTLDYMTKTTKAMSSVRSAYSDKSCSSESQPQEFQINVSTPGFVRAFCILLCNIIELAPRETCSKLQENGLIKLIFRALCLPSITIDNKKELALYCNILEMNTSVCIVLRKICSVNSTAVGTLLHTRDCLIVLISLLNSKIYHTNLSQLLYLRNRLWSEVFNLLATLLDGFNEDNVSPRNIESLAIVSETIGDIGVDTFLDVLSESLGYIGTNDLQHSSLTVLVALLRIECEVAVHKTNNVISKDHSIENILDTVRAPKTVIISSLRENIENVEPHKKLSKFTVKNVRRFDKYKRNVLEEAYFGKVTKKIQPQDEEEEIEISFIDSPEDGLMVGGELCKILLFLFELINIKCTRDARIIKKKSLVIAALTGILCISHEAKKYALDKGLLETIVKELKDYHIKLSLESVENLRRVQDKKRICPMLQDIVDLVGLLTNFMLNSESVKCLAANLNLADVIHKLWIWFLFQNGHTTDVLKMLSVYTLDCLQACRSLPLTSPVAGSGPRKTPSNVSLLHSIIALVVKEMDQISRTHDLLILELAFDVLHHCSGLLECRVVISKSNLFQSLTRLHPAVTKRQYPWDNVELLWLEFLQTYTRYPEGQTTLTKGNDVFDLIMALTVSNNEVNRQEALIVLRNITFYQPNRAKLLSSGEFLNILKSKLTNGSVEEKKTVVAIMWSLAANNQKAKIVFKSAKLDVKLENVIKCAEFLGNSTKSIEREDLKIMHLVLDVLRGNDKTTNRRSK